MKTYFFVIALLLFSIPVMSQNTNADSKKILTEINESLNTINASLEDMKKLDNASLQGIKANLKLINATLKVIKTIDNERLEEVKISAEEIETRLKVINKELQINNSLDSATIGEINNSLEEIKETLVKKAYNIHRDQVQTKVFVLDLGSPSARSITVKPDTIGYLTKYKNEVHKPRLVIKSRQLLAFELKNGNPYRYNYIINHKLVDFFSDDKATLDSGIANVKEQIKKQTLLATPSQKEATLKKIENLNATAFTNKKVLEKSSKQTTKDKKTIKEKEAQINTALQSMKSKDTMSISGEENIKQIIDKYDKIIQNFSDYENELKFFGEENIKQIIDEYDEIIKNLSDYENELKSLNDSVSIFSQKYIKESLKENAFFDKKAHQQNILSAYTFLKDEVLSLQREINQYISGVKLQEELKIDTLTKHRKKFNNEYKGLLTIFQKISYEALLVAQVDSAFRQAATTQRNEILSITDKIDQDILKMYQIKTSNYLLPIDVEGKNIDVVEVTLERIDKYPVAIMPVKYTYNIWINGGLKIDVSGGVFISSLVNREYILTDAPSGGKLVWERRKGNYDFGFGTMVNASIRGGSWVRPAFNVGLMFTNSQKFQLLSGLGLILGKEERIVLHGGISMGRINTAADENLKTDGSTAYNLGSSGTIEISEKFAFGHFFGFTYNFGKVKSQESK